MKLREDKGITMITLIITVVMLAILAYATVSIGINITGTAKFQNVQTYMLLIQSKCETLVNEKAIGEIDESGYYGIAQSGEKEGWYKLSQGDLNDMGVKGAKAKEGYYVNYETDDIMYERGVEYEGTIYHYLSEIKNLGK